MLGALKDDLRRVRASCAPTKCTLLNDPEKSSQELIQALSSAVPKIEVLMSQNNCLSNLDDRKPYVTAQSAHI